MALGGTTFHYVYYKKKDESTYKRMGIVFRDETYAAHEAANLMRMGFDVKIKRGKYYWFDSRRK